MAFGWTGVLFVSSLGDLLGSCKFHSSVLLLVIKSELNKGNGVEMKMYKLQQLKKSFKRDRLHPDNVEEEEATDYKPTLLVVRGSCLVCAATSATKASFCQ